MSGMSITAKLAAAQLRQNRKRTVFTLLGIILAAAMISAVFGFAQSGINGIGNLIRSHSNYHISFVSLSPENAAKIAADDAIESSYTVDFDGGQVGLYARLNQPSGDVIAQGRGIAEKYGIPSGSYSITRNTELLAVEGYLPDVFRNTIYSIAAILLLIIIGTSVIVVSNAFRVSAGERTMQFGMLKSVGATAKQIRQSVLYEGLFLTMIGVPLGIAAGLLGEAVVLPIANSMLSGLSSLGNIEIRFDFAISWQAILLSVAIGALTVFISALIPAYKAAKLSAIDAIRGSKDVKLKLKQVRTSKLTKKIFGFEGELAAKGIKRDRRGYRATVIAIASSVALFIVVTVFGEGVLRAASELYPNITATAAAGLRISGFGDQYAYTEEKSEDGTSEQPPEFDNDVLDSTFNKLQSYGGGTKVRMYATNYTYATYDDIISDQVKYLYEEDYNEITIVSLDRDTYLDIIRKAGAKDGQAVVLNYLSYRNNEGVRTILRPFKFTVGNMNIVSFSGEKQLNIGGEITEVPPELRLNMKGSLYIFTQNFGANEVDFYADTPDSAGFVAFAEDSLENLNNSDEQNGIYTFAQDIKAQLSATRGLAELIMLFIYGFIALLTLIGLTNVISTIMTNIRLRQREFAVLMSVGMTREGLRRSLNLESLMCGTRALLFGLPIGLILSFLLYQSLNGAIEIPYALPWIPLVCCIAAVFIVTFVTMKLASSRIRKGSIVETIRARD
jgi:putative ABC transport system permease protein